MNDNVNNPIHYTQGAVECIDCIKAAIINKAGIEAFCVGNAIKYLFRYENKNGLEDVKKAQWYINRLIQELEEKELPKPDNTPVDSLDDGITEGCCLECEYFDVRHTAPPCCDCKYTATEDSKEFNKRPLLFKPAK